MTDVFVVPKRCWFCRHFGLPRPCGPRTHMKRMRWKDWLGLLLWLPAVVLYIPAIVLFVAIGAVGVVFYGLLRALDWFTDIPTDGVRAMQLILGTYEDPKEKAKKRAAEAE